MKKFSWRNWVAVAAILSTTSANAAATRTIDAAAINNQGATLTLPSTTDTMVGRATSDTLTNKTISGASNTISGLAASVISSGQVGVANGGTGASTLTSNGILQGNGTSAVSAVGPGTQYQVLQAGVGGAPAFGAVSLGQAAAVSGQLPVGNGGTGASSLTAGSVVVGNGTSAVSLVAPSTAGNILTSNGSTWVSSAPVATGPTVVGSTASPTAITAVGGIAFSSTAYFTYNFITGSGGAVTVTASPQIAAGSNVGQQLILIGSSDTNTVTLSDGTGLSLNGPITMKAKSIIGLVWDGSVWAEAFRR